jgi:hypothetical protein
MYTYVYSVKGVTVNVIAGTRKYSASNIGSITGFTDVPSESRGARLTLFLILHNLIGCLQARSMLHELSNAMTITTRHHETLNMYLHLDVLNNKL